MEASNLSGLKNSRQNRFQLGSRGNSIMIKPEINWKSLESSRDTAAEQNQHPEMEYIEMVRQKLKKFMAQSRAGRQYENLMLLISVVSCFEYIYQTYLHMSVENDRRLLWRLNILELVFASLFAGDWCLNCFLAEHRILFFTSFFSMVDLFTVIPIFVTFGREMPNVNYIYTLNDALLYAAYGMYTTRILRALRIRRKLAKIEDVVERFMGELLLSIIVMILFFASVMQFLEYTYQPHAYHTWMYYIWVTISTVGYGDITPRSTQGRVAAMGIIGFSIISIPKMTNELIEKMALQSVYMRNAYNPKSKTSKHIVICGDVSSISLDEFFGELFHEDHENVDLNAILLLPSPPTTEIIFLLRDSSFFLNIQYLEGSALIDHDLRRAKAQLAVAIFIMTNKFSEKPDEEDAKSILLNLSIKRYVASFNLPPKLFCLQLIRPQNRKHLGRDAYTSITSSNSTGCEDLVVCLNEIKMGVLAKSVLYPGANTLLMNLISSFSDDEIPAEGESQCDDQEEGCSRWISEYKQGCGWEIYTTPLSPSFGGFKFADLSYLLYKRIGLILFALQITDENTRKTRLLLNPSDYIIPKIHLENILAFVIAENKQSSDLTFSERTVGKSGTILLSALIGDISGSALGASGIPWFSSLGQPKDSAESFPTGIPLPPAIDISSSSRVFEVDGSVRAGTQGGVQGGAGASRPTTPAMRPSSIDILGQRSFAGAKLESRNELLIQLKETHFRTNYFIRTHPLPFEEAIIQDSLHNKFPKMKNHIIIIGKGMTNIFDLIRPLRAKYIGVLRPIIILTCDIIDQDSWSRIAMFDLVYIIKGSALEERNLRRAGIFRSKRVVVLADGSLDRNSKVGSMAALVDSDAIFIYQRVKKMNPKTQVVIEMINTSNIGYLYTPPIPTTSTESETTAVVVEAVDNDYKFSTQFAAGELFTTSLLDSIVCQGYYNPHIINVIDKLISGVDMMSRADLISTVTDSWQSQSSRNNSFLYEGKDTDANGCDQAVGGTESEYTGTVVDAIQGSCLYQIALPIVLIGKTYKALFKQLSQNGIVPLGLLRGSGSPQLAAPYVYTNPSSDTVLNCYDRVFVLSVLPIEDEQDLPMILTSESQAGGGEDHNHTQSGEGNTQGTAGRRGSGSGVSPIGNPTADITALAAAQHQLRQDLHSTTADVNSKFDAIMTLLQPSSSPQQQQRRQSQTNEDNTPAPENYRHVRESRGVRLAPLQSQQRGAVISSGAGTATTPLPAVPGLIWSSPPIESMNRKTRADSFYSDGTDPRQRTGSTGSLGVFTFPRSRSASIAVDPGLEELEPEIPAGSSGKPGIKPNGTLFNRSR